MISPGHLMRLAMRAVSLAAGLLVLGMTYFPIQNLLGADSDGSSGDYVLTAASEVILGSALVAFAVHRATTAATGSSR